MPSMPNSQKVSSPRLTTMWVGIRKQCYMYQINIIVHVNSVALNNEMYTPNYGVN